VIDVQSKNPFTFFARRKNSKLFRRKAECVLALNGIKLKEDREILSRILETIYNGPKAGSFHSRHYHTTAHINNLFKAAALYFPENMAPLGTSLTSSELLGILFHDIVYCPEQTQNEQRSVDLMIGIMEAYGVVISEVCWASRIISETANHLKEVRDESTHAVLDLDLSIFADSWEVFLDNNGLIEKEFLNVTNEQRADFFQKLLDKPKIYYKLTQLEAKARENLQKQISLLYAKVNPCGI
jgi:predicted metal-dependent HD superfamily phosphohydrolase